MQHLKAFGRLMVKEGIVRWTIALILIAHIIFATLFYIGYLAYYFITH